jgi:hypothetical protein
MFENGHAPGIPLNPECSNYDYVPSGTVQCATTRQALFNSWCDLSHLVPLKSFSRVVTDDELTRVGNDRLNNLLQTV